MPIVSQEVLTASLMKAASLGLPADVQELLLYGDGTRGVPALILNKMLDVAIRTERERCAKAADGDWGPDCCLGIASEIRDPESAKPQL